MEVPRELARRDAEIAREIAHRDEEHAARRRAEAELAQLRAHLERMRRERQGDR